ncbi:Response regulator receiver domain protein [compost metagenome]
MPVMDGFEAFSLIQKIKPQLPVIANTAYAFPEDKTRIINAGFHGYITKPLNKDEIYALLGEILGTNSL